MQPALNMNTINLSLISQLVTVSDSDSLRMSWMQFYKLQTLILVLYSELMTS